MRKGKVLQAMPTNSNPQIDTSDPTEVESRFLEAFLRAYGQSTIHGSSRLRHRLAQKGSDVRMTLDLGLALALLEPSDGSSTFNIALLLADLNRSHAALMSFVSAINILDRADPDRDTAIARATEIAERLGCTNVVSVLRAKAIG